MWFTFLICIKKISVARQEWLAGRLGNKPLGARDTTRNIETCLGTYATYAIVQPHRTGHNTREEQQASSRRPQEED